MPIVRRNFPVGAWVALALALGTGLAAACSNRAQVFLEQQVVAFVDGDCYARMTRVRELIAHPGTKLTWHHFENYPFGTQPHTTLLFDGLILALRAVFSLAGAADALNLAGAWISPLLGAAMLAALWVWSNRERLAGGWAVLLVLAASPILAHGFALGRPDHQSLVLLCLAVALAAEWSFWRQASRRTAMIGGAAWAFGLWTSLYEPVILLGVVLGAGALFNRATLRRPERLAGLAMGGSVLLIALVFEGWPAINIPGFGAADGAAYFASWARQIGELQSMPPWSPALIRWTGVGLAAAPILLLLNRGEEQRSARAQLLVLLAVVALTCWQARWGYFLPLAYALSLPWQLASIAPRLRLAAAALFLLGLLPMAWEWQAQWRRSPDTLAALAEQRADNVSLHQAAGVISEASLTPNPAAAGILAPWWQSPPLAYWSGQPALAGSSHESLPGIVDVARFFVADNWPAASRILRRRQVRWVVAYDPDRVLSNASSLLDQPQISRHAVAIVLYEQVEAAPAYLRLVFVNQDFKVYEVLTAALPP